VEATPAVELAGVVRNYGERTALDGVSLTLAEGQTLVVFGANGAGKSTLLRVLATLLRPHGGTARVLGCMLPADAWRVRARLGLVGHDPLLYRELTARENLRYYARLYRVDEPRIAELLDAVRMTQRADEPLRTLSRGMVQRLAACRAVLHDPELLLLDEPRAHLDPAAADLLAPLVGRGARRADGAPRTRVVTSHDPTSGLAGADFALGLRAGRTAFVSPAAELDPAAVAELYW
jgi:heme exporter protein A